MKKQYFNANDFLSAPIIDAHVHMNTTHPYFCRVAQEQNVGLLCINTEVPEYPSLEDQKSIVLHHQIAYPNLLNFLTSIDTERIFLDPSWSDSAIAYIAQSIEQGARGVKVWKNIGMDLQRLDQSFLKISDDELKPVFDYLQKHQIPVLGHIGEPKNCWLPLSEMTVNNDRSYYAQHPEFHMYLHPDYPDYDTHIAARDRLLKLYPDLRFIGAHLGSMEWSVEEVAHRLDQYPNFYVDLTDRIVHLQFQSFFNRQQVKDFLYAYQDRIIYGTDLEFFNHHTEEEIRSKAIETWRTDWMYFTMATRMNLPAFDQKVVGLKLEKSVVQKIFWENALNCYNIPVAIASLI